MKVDKPRFVHNEVICSDCPFADNEGVAIKRLKKVCVEWRNGDEYGCPSSENYQQACAAADGKGEKG